MSDRRWLAEITRTSTCLALFILLSLASGVLAHEDYVWGEAAAMMSPDRGFEGYWKYCLLTSWDVSTHVEGSHGMSHVTIVLGLETCLAACGDACIGFPDTVGVGQGEGGCTVYYYAELDLNGDPTVPASTPTLKFEPYPATCEPGVSGVVSVCFYSLAPPDPLGASGYAWIKFGPYVEAGTIEGMLPSCIGTSALVNSTWSSIKRLFN
jgi:hypothetical protein